MKIYRIVSFFELLQTLRTGKLRVSSASQFSDPNEMVGYLFATLANPMFSPGTPEGLVRAQEEVNGVKESFFTSCWTYARDSIAMWEIYSPEKNSVQLEVRKEDVEAAFRRKVESAPWTEAHGKPPGWDKTIFYPLAMQDCRYENLEDLAKSIKEKTRAAALKASQAFDGRSLEEGMEGFQKVYDEARDNPDHRHDTLLFVKDEAYKHEQEVRFCLHAMRRNNLDYNECKEQLTFSMFDPHLDAATIKQTGPNIYLDFHKDVIRHVRIDGRCPSWLVELQIQLLAEHGVVASQSKAYGKFADRYPLDIWWDSHPS